jgi:hypothetical protein
LSKPATTTFHATSTCEVKALLDKVAFVHNVNKLAVIANLNTQTPSATLTGWRRTHQLGKGKMIPLKWAGNFSPSGPKVVRHFLANPEFSRDLIPRP